MKMLDRQTLSIEDFSDFQGKLWLNDFFVSFTQIQKHVANLVWNVSVAVNVATTAGVWPICSTPTWNACVSMDTLVNTHVTLWNIFRDQQKQRIVSERVIVIEHVHIPRTTSKSFLAISAEIQSAMFTNSRRCFAIKSLAMIT